MAWLRRKEREVDIIPRSKGDNDEINMIRLCDNAILLKPY